MSLGLAQSLLGMMEERGQVFAYAHIYHHSLCNSLNYMIMFTKSSA